MQEIEIGYCVPCSHQHSWTVFFLLTTRHWAWMYGWLQWRCLKSLMSVCTIVTHQRTVVLTKQEMAVRCLPSDSIVDSNSHVRKTCSHEACCNGPPTTLHGEHETPQVGPAVFARFQREDMGRTDSSASSFSCPVCVCDAWDRTPPTLLCRCWTDLFVCVAPASTGALVVKRTPVLPGHRRVIHHHHPLVVSVRVGGKRFCKENSVSIRLRRARTKAEPTNCWLVVRD